MMTDKEFGSLPDEYDNAAAEVSPPVVENALPEEPVCHAADEHTIPEEYTARHAGSGNEPEGRKRIVTLILAALMVTLIGSPAVQPDEPDGGAVPSIEEQDDNAPQSISDVLAPVTELITVPDADPLPENPYIGVSDAELLIQYSPWQGDGITVSFLPDGTGWWTSGRCSSRLAWQENSDGSVAYSGSAMTANDSSSNSSSDPSSVDDGIYFLSLATAEGTVSVDRTALGIQLENPLGSSCSSYLPGSGEPSSPMEQWLTASDEEILSLGAWVRREDEIADAVRISCVRPLDDGSYEVTVDHVGVLLCRRLDETDRGESWFALVNAGLDGDDSVWGGPQLSIALDNYTSTSIIGGLNCTLAFIDEEPCLAFFDPLDDTSFELTLLRLSVPEADSSVNPPAAE